MPTPPQPCNKRPNGYRERFDAEHAKYPQRTQNITENEIGTALIGAAIKVHSVLGPGLLESAYEACLVYELEKLRLPVKRQVTVPLRYEDLRVDVAYRIDLLIDDLVVAELKVVESIVPVHRSQLLSYLRLGGYRLGYLLNFNVLQMRDGIVRMVNGL